MAKWEKRSKTLKSCNGNCLKTSLKCDGYCSWDQCELADGSCTPMIDRVEVDYGVVSGKVKVLKFGICGGNCVEVLTNTSVPACNGRCELVPGTKFKKREKDTCHLTFLGSDDPRLSW
eukprot:TRINITY_DN15591_c0_g1_i1.p1 TRINITY_DN15591_c0_g1~~TRINITY_DN15591_c0_g1_i1.p1  ORF type:complete len:118 (-),score=12.34 TRINITY_DN15591_c0_g1_i1:125-478(-)